jgi:hypothetical protein
MTTHANPITLDLDVQQNMALRGGYKYSALWSL